MATKTEHLAPLLEVLTNLPPGAKLELTKLPTGEFAVSEEQPPKTREKMLEEYAHLKGRGITIPDAVVKYGVPRGAIEKWVYRTGDVSFVDESRYPKLVNEAEVALCASIYKERQKTGLTGIPYFDEHGVYLKEVKHPHRSRRPKQRAA